jgi:hypothetical protein
LTPKRNPEHVEHCETVEGDPAYPTHRSHLHRRCLKRLQRALRHALQGWRPRPRRNIASDLCHFFGHVDVSLVVEAFCRRWSSQPPTNPASSGLLDTRRGDDSKRQRLAGHISAACQRDPEKPEQLPVSFQRKARYRRACATSTSRIAPAAPVPM